nr:NACHT domain-containing protein [Crenobacter cavernae]
MFLLGTAGQGKSTLLRYLCINEIERDERIALFASLKNIDEKTTLESLLFDSLAKSGIDIENDKEALSAILKSGKCAIFLDGYDEIKRVHSMEFKKELESKSRKFPNTTWILSSRPGALFDHLSEIHGFKSIPMDKLSESDFQPYLEKIGVAVNRVEKITHSLKKQENKRVKEVLSTPLLLTLFFTVYGDHPEDIPDNIPEFYQNLFSTLSICHDKTKPGYTREKASQLSNENIRALFECFCYLSLKEGGTSIENDSFEEFHKKATKIAGVACHAEAFKTDMTDNICLMKREDSIHTTFIHKTIQEFFAAYFIKHIEDEEIGKKYTKNLIISPPYIISKKQLIF